jgi:hypothetical protein
MLAAIGAAKWTLATSFSFLRYRGAHGDAAGRDPAGRCPLPLPARLSPGLDRRTYGRLLAFARVLRETVASLAPPTLRHPGDRGVLADVPN